MRGVVQGVEFCLTKVCYYENVDKLIQLILDFAE